MKKLAPVFIWLIFAVPCQARIITIDDDGPADFDNIQAATDSNSAVYFLITNESLRDAFQQLVDRRTVQGKQGKLITVETIDANYPGVDIQEKIRNCIKHHYLNHGTMYVALGGDDNVVPVRYCSHKGDPNGLVPTDLYYSDMNGGTWNLDGDDYYGEVGDVTEVELTPDVYLGRIPVRTAEHANAYIHKVEIYEAEWPEGFANSMIFLSGDDPGSTGYSADTRPLRYRHHDPVGRKEVVVMDRYLDFVQAYWQAVPVHFFTDTISPWDEASYGDYDLTISRLVEHLSRGDGYHFVLFSGHGNPALWGFGWGRRFNTNRAGELTNSVPSIIVSGGCSTAGFDLLETCLSEALLRNPHGGAVAVFGAPRTTGGGLRDSLLVHMFQEQCKTVGEAMTKCLVFNAPLVLSNPYNQYNLSLQGDPCIHIMQPESGRHLQLFLPRGCEVIEQHSNVVIRWNAAGTDFEAGDKVRLEYSADSGRTWNPIPGAQVLPYNGRVFDWENCPLAAGSNYRVRVVALADPQVSDMSGQDFTIGELGLLTVHSLPLEAMFFSPGANLTTTFNVTALKGSSITLPAPNLPPLTFVHWSDNAGNTLTDQAEYTFTFTDDTTIVAEYEYLGPIIQYYVSVDGDDDNNGLTPEQPMRHIQQLLNKYPEIGWDAVVDVSAGIYQENITINGEHTGLQLEGAGQAVTIIDANHNGSCIYLENFAAGMISYFSITNGSEHDGGGIRCIDSSPTIAECIVTNNNASVHGGGMYVAGVSRPEIIDCVFTDNRSGWRGGAVENTDSSCAEFHNCVFTSNSSPSYGGAIHNTTNSKPNIIKCVFMDNTGVGGAICNYKNSAPLISSCLFVGNHSSTRGGGIFNTGYCSPVIENSLFCGNSANRGGGIANEGGYAPIITNCTFSGNFARKENGGGGMHVENISGATMTNCIFWNNTAKSAPELYVSNKLTISYSDVKGGWSGVSVGPDAVLTWGAGNIHAEPCFVNPGHWADPNDPNILVEPDDPNAVWVDGDYRLKSHAGRWEPNSESWVQDDVTSPCIDAGNPGCPTGSEPSPNGNRINMGADGGTAEASKTPPKWSLLPDLTNDGIVNFEDYAFQAADWLNPGDPQPGDLNRNGVVDLADIALLAEDWLKQTTWHE